MTDKQMIIDSVDVSECDFLIISNDKQLCHCIKSDLFGGIEFVENAKNGNCKDNPNCYYKQLKRKEQECEELKRLISKQKNAKIQLSKLKDKQYKEFCDMKQTLIEIKEIVEGMHDLWINKTPYTDMDNLVKHLLECELNRIRYKLD